MTRHWYPVDTDNSLAEIVLWNPIRKKFFSVGIMIDFTREVNISFGFIQIRWMKGPSTELVRQILKGFDNEVSE